MRAGKRIEQLGHGGSYLIIGTALQALIGFAANLVLVRFLAPEAFGRFALVFAAANLVLGIMSLRLNVLIIRTPEPGLDQRLRSTYCSALTIETVAGTLITLAWLWSTELQSLYEVLLVLSVGLGHWTGHNRAFFERRMTYRGLAAVEGGSVLAAHVLSVLLAVGGLGAATLYVREICVTVVQAVGLAAMGALTVYPFRWLRLGEWRALFREARGVWLDSVLEGSFQRIVVLIVGHVAGERETGFFWQAFRLAMVPQQLLSPLVSRMVPTWFGQVLDGGRRQRGRRYLLLVGTAPLALAALVALLFADPLVPFVFGETWRPAAPLLSAMSGMVFFLTLFEISRAYCLTARFTRVLLVSRVMQYAAFLVPLPVLFILVPDQVLPAAWGLSFAFGAAFLVAEAGLRLAEWRRRP